MTIGGEEFNQTLQTSMTSIHCVNQQQSIESLPAPFRYHEGMGVKCLDYKQRYCCKSKSMFRPQNIKMFGRFFDARIPLGPTIVSISRDTQGETLELKLKIKSCVGVEQSLESKIKMIGRRNLNGNLEGVRREFIGSLVASKELSLPITGHL